MTGQLYFPASGIGVNLWPDFLTNLNMMTGDLLQLAVPMDYFNSPVLCSSH